MRQKREATSDAHAVEATLWGHANGYKTASIDPKVVWTAESKAGRGWAMVIIAMTFSPGGGARYSACDIAWRTAVESKKGAVASGTGSSCCRPLSRLRRCLNPFHHSVSLLRSSNRTCGFPASGSPTGFTSRLTQAPAPANGRDPLSAATRTARDNGVNYARSTRGGRGSNGQRAKAGTTSGH